MSKEVRKVWEQMLGASGGWAFETEETVRAKALKQGTAGVLGDLRQPELTREKGVVRGQKVSMGLYYGPGSPWKRSVCTLSEMKTRGWGKRETSLKDEPWAVITFRG